MLLYYNQNFLLLQFVTSLFQVGAQVWRYDSGGSDFEWKYKTWQMQGKGNEFPYQKPFIINSQEYNSVYIRSSKKLQIFLIL